ncbi:hypothetical protein GE061_014122 [Apolygus lucorum]|uniref:PLAT domain-containing protein n=1 Tax=Apolygus lucorum TaxID=248454 RepID=A0A8S9XQZ1_APOLU|nr:hypothetical protein GE061_014122 [Apolygus lucorum]
MSLVFLTEQLFDKSKPLDPPPWVFPYKPNMIPFMNSPIYNPFNAYWIRGFITVFDHNPIGPKDWPIRPKFGDKYSYYGWSSCLYYTFEDGRAFCSISQKKDNIWHLDVKNFGAAHLNREECLTDIDERIYYTDKYLCDLVPARNAYRIISVIDKWFTVDLDPSNPEAIMIPGDPLPVGKKFKMRMFLTNSLRWSNFNFDIVDDSAVRHISWRYTQNLTLPAFLTYSTTYLLHFRHCTFTFTFSGCSTNQETEPVYHQHQEIVIRAEGHVHPSVKGCPTMQTVSHYWYAEPAVRFFNEDGTYDWKKPARNRDPSALNYNYQEGPEESGGVKRIKWDHFILEYHKFQGFQYNGSIVVVHDFELKGHPRSHVSLQTGLSYITRDLCFFKFRYLPEIIKPVSEYISKKCEDESELQLKITRPFYFREPFVISWWCLDPEDPDDPCTKVQTTKSEFNKFNEYEDFSYKLPLACHDYTWVMKVDYLERPIESFDRTNQYQIFIERKGKEKEDDIIVPDITMKTLTVSHKTETVNPDEPNYFYIVTNPHEPDIWDWTLYKILQRLKTGATKKQKITKQWRQPRTSTFVCIIEPNVLEQDKEYLLISQSKLGRASYSFTANSPPKPGSCSIQPESGVVGSVFHVQCKDFTDNHSPLSFTVVESGGLDEMPWLQYFTFESGVTVENDVRLFNEDVSALIFDDEGMHTRIPLKVKLTGSQPLPDINIFLTIQLPVMAVNEKLVAVEEMAKYTRYFDHQKIRFEEEQKVFFIEALSNTVDHNAPPAVLDRSMIEVKYYDQKQMTEVFTSIASTIMQHPDTVIVNDTIREDVHEAHRKRASQGSFHALQAMEKIGEARIKKQYFQLQPTFNSTHKGVTMLVQVNNGSTFNSEFTPDRIKEHTLTLPQETVEKYKDAIISTVMIISTKQVFWWLPNWSGILSVSVKHRRIGEENANWTKMEGPFNIYLKLRNFETNYGTVNGHTRTLPICPTPLRYERVLKVYQLKAPIGDGVVYLSFPKSSFGHLKVLISDTSRPTYEEVSSTGVLNNDYMAHDFKNLDKKWTSDIYVGVLPVNYTITPVNFKYKIVQCKTFQNENFEATGCQYKEFIDTDQEEPRIRCQCDHLSWFSSDIITPPQKIVLSEDIYLFSTITDNFYVALLTGLLLLLLVILLLWGRGKDRQDSKARFVTVLRDNWCDETNPYILAVFTGERWGSGTTSRVAIRLFGEKGHSRVHILSHHRRRVLKMGLDDWFLIKTKNPLGPVHTIQLWHNHSGFAPEWYCRKVLVYDVKTEEIYNFIVEAWFTFDHRVSLSDARMHEIPLMKPEEEASKWQYYISGWIFSGMRDKHVWASIFTRHPRSLYTRCQRAVIAVGLIITTMLTSMMFFDFSAGPSDLPVFSISLSDVVVGIQSAIVAMILQLSIVICFEMSKKQKIKEMKEREKERLEKENQGKDQGKDQKKEDFAEGKVIKSFAPKPIPYEAVTLNATNETKSTTVTIFFLVLAWVLAITSITLCSFFIILYGLKFGSKKSLVWIISFMSGIVTDSILFQPLKMIFFAVIVSLIFRKSNVDTFVMEVKYEEVEQEEMKWRDCLKRMMELRLGSPYHPVRTDRIKKTRTIYGSRRIRYLIYYAIISALLLIMIFLFLYGFEVKDSYYGTRQLDFYFRNGSDQLRTKENMYELIHHDVIPALHRVYWYNQITPLPLEANEKNLDVGPFDPRLTSKARGYMQDCTNKLVGVPRLRQLRLKDHNVQIPRVFVVYFDHAYGKYFAFREDTASYLPGWIIPDKSNGNISQMWHYRSALATESSTVQGRSGWIYGGGGYVARLSWNRGDSWRALQLLEMENWADKRTRAIVMEINLYNNNIKRFTEMRFIIEALPNGVYMSRYQLRATSFFFKKKPEAQLIIALTVIMTFVLLTLGFFVIVQISRDGFFVFFSELRGFLDVIVFGLGLSTVGHFFNRALQFSLFLEEMDDAPHDAYTSLYGPFALDADAHIVFGLFTLAVAIHAMLTVYQGVGFKKFYFVFSNIAGLLVTLIVLNVTLTYIIHYTTSTDDREPMENTFLHSTFRDYQITEKGQDANTRIIYVIVLPIVMILIKFNAACIIFFHLWYTEETMAKTYFKSRRSEKEEGGRRKKDVSRVKGRFWIRQKPFRDVFKLRIHNMRTPFVILN